MSTRKDLIKDRPTQSYPTIILDVGLIVGVVALLTAIQLLVPESVKAVLAFSHSEFNVWGLYTATFVHADAQHLFNNVTAYLIASAYTYWLCFAADTRKWFRRTFIAFLTVLPPVVSFTSFLIMQAVVQGTVPPERGFSGVASGFGGFLLISLIVYLWKRYNPELGTSAGGTVLFLLLVEIDYIYTGKLDPLVIGISLAGVAVMTGRYLWKHGIPFDRKTMSLQALKPVVLSELVVLVLTYLVLVMFPEIIIENGYIKNIFAHAAGFIWGGLFAIATLTSLG